MSYSSPPWGRTTKAIIASASLVLLALATWQFRSLIAPVVSAVIVAYLLNPLITFFQRKITVSRGTAVLIVYVLLIRLVVGGGLFVGLTSVEQVSLLITQLPTLTENAIELFQAQAERLMNIPIPLGTVELNPATALEQLDATAIVNQITGLIQPFLTRGTSFAAWFAQTAIRLLSLSVLVFALSIYVARDFPKFGRAISDFAHQPGYRQDTDRLLDDFTRIWNAYLRGQVVLALVIGSVVTATLVLLGVNNALGLGLLAGLLEFLPIVGPVVSTLTAVLVSLFQSEPFFGLNPLWRPAAVAVAMIVIQQIENNVLVPRIVGKALDLHPLITMVAVLMGASLAGILGAILAAPVIASIKLLGAYAWRKMLDLPPFADTLEDDTTPVPQDGQPGSPAQPDAATSPRPEEFPADSI